MPEKPNIIFIMPDQLRADFVGCYEIDYVNTPNIDSLAEHGVRYERCHSPHPLCVPARVSLLTGMDAIKNGVLDNGQFLRPDYAQMGIRTWPEMLVENGYYTAAIGKMHFYPWDLRLGFQYRVIAEDKRWIHIRDDYYHFLKAHGHRKLHGNEHPGYYENKGAIVSRIPWEYSVDHFVGQEACRFIAEHGNEGPFAMMVGFPGPHCPYDPSPEFLAAIDVDAMPPAIPEVEGDMPELRRRNVEGNKRPWNGVDYTEFTAEQKKRIRAHYAALVGQIDYEVGQILDTLEQQGLTDSTVILFSADHGDYLGDHNLIGKGTFFQSGIRVPLLAHIPWHGSTVCSDLVTLSDVTATILRLAGCDIPDYMDSLPLPRLDLSHGPSRDCIVGMIQGGWMIYDGEWRLSRYATGEALLFHVKADPHEQHNLFHDPGYIGVRDSLDARLTQAIMRSMREANQDRRVYTRDLSQHAWFGREGWQRLYPRPVSADSMLTAC
jgi:arylsulfatase A-like enzyme